MYMYGVLTALALRRSLAARPHPHVHEMCHGAVVYVSTHTGVTLALVPTSVDLPVHVAAVANAEHNVQKQHAEAKRHKP